MNDDVKKELIDKLNEIIDLPILSEKAEERLIRLLVELVWLLIVEKLKRSAS